MHKGEDGSGKCKLLRAVRRTKAVSLCAQMPAKKVIHRIEEWTAMHILMYRWKAYNYRDIEQTFLLLGHTVDNIEQELGSYDVSPEFERVIEEKIRGTHYDMVFTVNYFPLISNVCERTGVKYVSWTCDNPLISMYHESVFHDCNYIFTFDKTNYLEFRGMGVKHIWYLRWR